MKKEHVEPFKDKHVKLQLNDGFVIDGVIDAVYDDCLKFTTKQKTSLIKFQMIAMLSEK